MTPLISIIVLTRDRAESLKRTLQALKLQTHPNYEIVVVDNASIDETKKIAYQFETRYVFSKADNGFAASRQIGIDAAQGEIIAMCDDDCVPNADWLDTLESRLNSEHDIGLVAGHVINIGFSQEKLYKGRTIMGENGQLSFVEDPRKADFFGSANMAFKRKAVEQFGGYDPFFKGGYEELDLVMNLRRHNFKTAYEPSAVVEHYFTGVSYKAGRWFWSGQLMRIYFYLKYFKPRTIKDWGKFWTCELSLLGKDLSKIIRPIGASILRFEVNRWHDLSVKLFNAITARLVIPWLLWKIKRQKPA